MLSGIPRLAVRPCRRLPGCTARGKQDRRRDEWQCNARRAIHPNRRNPPDRVPGKGRAGGRKGAQPRALRTDWTDRPLAAFSRGKPTVARRVVAQLQHVVAQLQHVAEQRNIVQPPNQANRANVRLRTRTGVAARAASLPPMQTTRLRIAATSRASRNQLLQHVR